MSVLPPGPPAPLPPASGVLRVLGIDPGTRLVGWGVVDGQGTRTRAVACGVLRVPPRAPIAERLARLAEGLEAVLGAWAPHEAALEEVFAGRDVRAAVRIGEGRGAILAVLARAGLPVRGYANNVVKKAVGGAGRASKEQVLRMVTRVLGLTETPETLDASDALALALCHHQRRAFQGGRGGASDLPPRVQEAIERARRTEPRKKL